MMRALKAFDYNGQRVQAGSDFEPRSARDAHVLALAQLAAEIEEPPKKNKKRYQDRQMRVEDE